MPPKSSVEPKKSSWPISNIPTRCDGEKAPKIDGNFYLYITPEEFTIPTKGQLKWSVRNATSNRWVQWRAEFKSNPWVKIVEGSHGYIRGMLAPEECVELTMEYFGKEKVCEGIEKLIVISNCVFKTEKEAKEVQEQMAKEKPELVIYHEKPCEMFKQPLAKDPCGKCSFYVKMHNVV